MFNDKFAMFAKLEDDLRAALNGIQVPDDGLTKTARRKLAKANRHRPRVVQRPLQRAFAHIILTARHQWGGKPVRIDYQHHNCSTFEAQLAVDRMLAKQKLIMHVLIKKEVVHDALS